ncbi:MAG TPA: PepSY-associated TM helix domain-containing protein [Azonexus sp.]
MAPKFSFRSLCPSVRRTDADAAVSRPPAEALRRARSLKLLLKLHWISSAVCLLGMLLFSFTGITLNHAAQIEAKPVTQHRTAMLPAELLQRLQQDEQSSTTVPPELAAWAASTWHVGLDDAAGEWSADELYIPLPRPGGDAWLRVGLVDGDVEYERTDRGWISWLNDLHKGRHTGTAWSWFIDLFAVGCLLFSLTGLLILKAHAAQRLSTWPLVGLGVIVPVLIALLFIH